MEKIQKHLHLYYPDTTIGKSRHKGGANETKAIHEDSLHLEPSRDNTYLSDGLETDTLCARELVTILVTAGSD